MSTPSQKILYHEKQKWRLCGLHAVNNLLGSQVYSAHDFNKIARDLMKLEPGTIVNPHKSIFGIGNYDINVIETALILKGLECRWFDSRKGKTGLILSHKSKCSTFNSEPKVAMNCNSCPYPEILLGSGNDPFDHRKRTPDPDHYHLLPSEQNVEFHQEKCCSSPSLHSPPSSYMTTSVAKRTQPQEKLNKNESELFGSEHLVGYILNVSSDGRFFSSHHWIAIRCLDQNTFVHLDSLYDKPFYYPKPARALDFIMDQVSRCSGHALIITRRESTDL